jgi:acyl-CoA hydrolase
MRRTTPAALADVVSRHAVRRPTHPDGPRVLASGNFATPLQLLRAVDLALARYRLHLLNAQPGIPTRAGVTHETAFVGPGMRRSPTLAYVPSRLSLLPHLLRTELTPDVVLLHCSRPYLGKVSLGTEVNVLPAAVEAARERGGLVLAQLNARMPYTFGDGELDVDLVDHAIEVDHPLPGPSTGTPDEISASIGRQVAALVPNGATLQLGIGAVPNSTLAALTGHSGLRIWSEMVSDGVLLLDDAGALDPAAPVVASFLFGSPRLYYWVHRNPRVHLARTERSNDPTAISRQPAMTSINSALQVDLFAQANASRLGARIHSGFGGATDFLVGALHSPGGQALVALPSWHPRAQVSTIVPLLENPATSFQPGAVVTEHGVAALRGRTERQQAAALIEVAHPDVRAELAEEARYLGIG